MVATERNRNTHTHTSPYVCVWYGVLFSISYRIDTNSKQMKRRAKRAIERIERTPKIHFKSFTFSSREIQSIRIKSLQNVLIRYVDFLKPFRSLLSLFSRDMEKTQHEEESHKPNHNWHFNVKQWQNTTDYRDKIVWIRVFMQAATRNANYLRWRSEKKNTNKQKPVAATTLTTVEKETTLFGIGTAELWIL